MEGREGGQDRGRKGRRVGGSRDGRREGEGVWNWERCDLSMRLAQSPIPYPIVVNKRFLQCCILGILVGGGSAALIVGSYGVVLARLAPNVQTIAEGKIQMYCHSNVYTLVYCKPTNTTVNHSKPQYTVVYPITLQ